MALEEVVRFVVLIVRLNYEQGDNKPDYQVFYLANLCEDADGVWSKWP